MAADGRRRAGAGEETRVEGGGEKAIVARGKDKLAFMDSRANSTPLDSGTIRAHILGVHSRVEAGRRGRGREAHEVGTILNIVYMRHGDAVLGLPSFRQLVLKHWPEKEDDAYDYMIVARHCTAEQAEKHGYWKSLYGIRLVDRLGLKSFGDVESYDFGADADGLPITFARMTIEEVRDWQPVPRLPENAPTEKAGRTVQKLRENATRLKQARPEYGELGTRIFVRDGKPTVTFTAVDRDGAEAARRFLVEVWKLNPR